MWDVATGAAVVLWDVCGALNAAQSSLQREATKCG